MEKIGFVVIYTYEDVIKFKKEYEQKHQKNTMKLNLVHCIFQSNKKSIYDGRNFK
jgi:hypothetical protein